MRISDWSSDVCSSDLTVERFIDGIEPDGPVENLLAVRTGAGPVHFGFAGHLDVVPPGVGWTGDAFDPQVRGELLYGRGAVDMKGAIAAFAAAAAATPARSEKRRVGKECVRTCRYRWSQDH